MRPVSSFTWQQHTAGWLQQQTTSLMTHLSKVSSSSMLYQLMHTLVLSHLLLTQLPSKASASAAGPTSLDSCCSACCLLLL
jgi:hypothetical protein